MDEMTTTTTAAPEKIDWVISYCETLMRLKSLSESQQLLLTLSKKENKTSKDQKILATLIKSEKAFEKAKAARAAVSSMMSTAKKEDAISAKNSHTQGLVDLGLLFDYAGIGHLSREELLGLLIESAKVNRTQVQEWSAAGSVMLALKEPAKIAPAAQILA